MKPITLFAAIVATGIFPLTAAPSMPREDVIEFPAIGEDLSVNNLFQSNMVIQRNKPVSIWGWAKAGEKVTVRLGGTEQSATAAADRSWKVTFAALEANSEPQPITIKGTDKTLTLDNVLVGDVWVLGGQSNMEFPLNKVENGNLEIVSANYPKIRILTAPAMNGPEMKNAFARLHEWSDWSKRHFRKGDWDVCSPEIAEELSAIGYVFARRIHTAANVPIGVIDTSRGGTTVETWTPDSALRKIDTPQVKNLLTSWDEKVAAWDGEADLKQRIEGHRSQVEKMKKQGKEMPANKPEPTDLRPGPPMDANRPGNCYASMIAPLEGLQVKGAIFHQGYNNCFSGTEGAIMYGQIFPKMIEAWRAAFEDPEMPFGILSLCTEGAVQTLENYTEAMANPGPYIREAQYQTFLDLYLAGDKNIGFVSTYDLRRRWYHPQLKVPAGERIARWALGTEYGFEKQIRWKPPIITEMLAEGGNIQVNFDEAVDAVDDGSPIYGFAIAGEDRKFHPADANYLVTGKDDRGREQKDNKSIILTSIMVPNPIHYRYAWARSPLANLQASRVTDIPIATQRSDNWALEEIPLEVVSDDPAAKPDRRKATELLKKEDLRRHLKQAQILIEANQ
jgi:sialate O-acetylesterase